HSEIPTAHRAQTALGKCRSSLGLDLLPGFLGQPHEPRHHYYLGDLRGILSKMGARHLLFYPMIPFCFRRSLAVRLAGLLFIQGGIMAGLQAQEATSIPGMIAEYEAKVRANTMKIIEAKTEAEKAQYRATVPSA